MRDHYDFSKMKARKNPYAKALKQPITIRIVRKTVGYFKAMAKKTGLPYQNLMLQSRSDDSQSPNGISPGIRHHHQPKHHLTRQSSPRGRRQSEKPPLMLLKGG